MVRRRGCMRISLSQLPRIMLRMITTKRRHSRRPSARQWHTDDHTATMSRCALLFQQDLWKGHLRLNTHRTWFLTRSGTKLHMPSRHLHMRRSGQSRCTNQCTPRPGARRTTSRSGMDKFPTAYEAHRWWIPGRVEDCWCVGSGTRY